MAKFKFYAAIAAMTVAALLFLTSCNNEKDPPKDVVFGVSENSLAFLVEGESKTLDVNLENGRGEWTATIPAEDSGWLTLDYDGSASGTLTVTAGGNTLDESRRTVITLSTEGHADLTVEVEQYSMTDVVFGVSENSLAFAVGGESKTLDVNLENGRGEWTATVPAEDSGWLTLNYDGSASGTLTVTANENLLYEPRTTVITLSTEGHADLTVEVEQYALFADGEPEHTADRTSWWRMNIKGHVNKMSSYYDYMADYLHIQNLEFNRYGMLEKFSYVYPYIFTTDEVHIEYDSEIRTRITKIYCPSNDNHYPYQIIFHYGDHGKYITTYDAFMTFDSQGLNTFWQIWMPALIKDLETIEVVEHAMNVYDGLKLVYSFSGNTGSSKMVLSYEGELIEEPHHTMVYDGAYPKSVDYMYALMGPMPMTSDYDINHANGYFRKFDWSYSMDFSTGPMSETWTSKTYNDDSNNSVASMFNFSYGITAPETCIYNDRKDLIQVGLFMSATYTYDSRDNWTKATVTADSSTTEYNCVIEYFD